MIEKKKYRLAECTMDLYFQKSHRFLFPLLNITMDKRFTPIQTFLSWKEHPVPDHRLICGYEIVDSSEYRAFERDILLHNEFFEDFKEGINGEGIYIFNLERYRNDIDWFLVGYYSRMSEPVKNKILKWYDNPLSREYMDSYLNPHNHYETYVRHLYDPPERSQGRKLIKKVGELCNPFDPAKETLQLTLAQVKLPVDE